MKETEEKCKKIGGNLKDMMEVKEKVEDVKSVLLKCREEGRMEVTGVAEVEALVQGMDEVKKKVEELVVEIVRTRERNVETMDVEGAEMMDWSEVVKRGRKKQGPMVVIESKVGGEGS